MKITNYVAVGVSFLIASALASTSVASLSKSYQFNGKGNWSLDAVGSNSTPVGDISAYVPSGSTVEAAFLYSSLYSSSTVPTVDFDGLIYTGSDWVDLGATAGLKAWRTDVTDQVSAKIGGGSDTMFTFSVFSESPNTTIDGEVLAIIYSNPLEQERTIAFLDGFSATSGDTTSINLLDPLSADDLSDPDFEALMSLGIGYGYQPAGQYSQVDVNGERLTTSAGGQDDGGAFNGGLITVGGLGDSTDNPPDPFATDGGGALYDDELYNISPFLSVGDTSIMIDTLNPSNNDNIFFAGFNITAYAGVNAPPPPPPPPPAPPKPAGVPDSGTNALLMALGIGAIIGLRRRFR